MANSTVRSICWASTWNKSPDGAGLEYLLLAPGMADSVVLAVDEALGPFRLAYRLQWNEQWQLREAVCSVAKDDSVKTIALHTDGNGYWHDAQGRMLSELDGCTDIDIWPTPFTNSFQVRRKPMAINERRFFQVAWVFGPDLTFRPQRQAYTRLADREYLFENLDGSGFKAVLTVDEDGVVIDYPGLFRRLGS